MFKYCMLFMRQPSRPLTSSGSLVSRHGCVDIFYRRCSNSAWNVSMWWKYSLAMISLQRSNPLVSGW